MNLIIENPISTFNAKELPLKEAFLLTQQAIGQTLDASLVFTSLDDMFNLNNQLRGKPQPTDVLSLPSEPNVGEVFICPEYVFNQQYDTDRIVHLWIHGLLHLAGFTHDHDDDFAIMSKYETIICNQLGLKDPY